MFVSHTGELARYPSSPTSYVQAAIDAVLTARHRPANMAHFPNRHLTPSAIDRQMFERTDVYVGIIGFRWAPLRRTLPRCL